jgi:hypothetical protein
VLHVKQSTHARAHHDVLGDAITEQIVKPQDDWPQLCTRAMQQPIKQPVVPSQSTDRLQSGPVVLGTHNTSMQLLLLRRQWMAAAMASATTASAAATANMGLSCHAAAAGAAVSCLRAALGHNEVYSRCSLHKKQRQQKDITDADTMLG